MNLNRINILHLCVNCLSLGAIAYPIGFDRGSQQDPYRLSIELCTICIGCLEDGDLVAFRKCSRDERVVKVRDGNG